MTSGDISPDRLELPDRRKTERLAALRSYDILDTYAEEGFDDIVQLAAMICETPVALVTLVDENRQWFKAKIGFDGCETPLSQSICSFAMLNSDVTVIPDLTLDDRTKNNTLVTFDPHIRFYAGAPLTTPDGVPLGSLCVIDIKPRPEGLTPRQTQSLKSLARQVMAQLELRRVTAIQKRQIEQGLLDLSTTHDRWSQLFDRLHEGFVIADMMFDAGDKASDMRYVDMNPAWETLTGLDRAGAIGQLNSSIVQDFEQDWLDFYGEVVKTGRAASRINQVAALRKWFDVHAYPVDGNRFAILFLDITEQKDAEARLVQSQKMEAVGQLTGGLAHDFNNLLTVVSGSLEMIDIRIGQKRFDETERFIEAARGAAKRGASLTHRLLAFSRQQTLDPQPTDVNILTSGMEEMVRRSVGPEIAVEVVGAAGLWRTHVDRHQLENALLNLCINARDAMPDGGKLTIETANRWIDDHAGLERDLERGQYVSLCVSDTGTGMSPEVMAKAFDPFFTTKPAGKGTGLGLSMTYGFARQSGGQLRIYSETGKGTMVCIYLPRHYGESETDETPQSHIPDSAQHGETILLIDDEPNVRMLAAETLADLGYTVIEAGDGPSAMKTLRSDARIDLLVTDFGLPNGMNGRQIADAARNIRPGLNVLFITGYAENAAIGHGHLEPGMAVMTKPFALDDFAARVREMIPEGERPARNGSTL